MGKSVALNFKKTKALRHKILFRKHTLSKTHRFYGLGLCLISRQFGKTTLSDSKKGVLTAMQCNISYQKEKILIHSLILLGVEKWVFVEFNTDESIFQKDLEPGPVMLSFKKFSSSRLTFNLSLEWFVWNL